MSRAQGWVRSVSVLAVLGTALLVGVGETLGPAWALGFALALLGLVSAVVGAHVGRVLISSFPLALPPRVEGPPPRIDIAAALEALQDNISQHQPRTQGEVHVYGVKLSARWVPGTELYARSGTFQPGFWLADVDGKQAQAPTLEVLWTRAAELLAAVQLERDRAEVLDQSLEDR